MKKGNITLKINYVESITVVGKHTKAVSEVTINKRRGK